MTISDMTVQSIFGGKSSCAVGAGIGLNFDMPCHDMALG